MDTVSHDLKRGGVKDQQRGANAPPPKNTSLAHYTDSAYTVGYPHSFLLPYLCPCREDEPLAAPALFSEDGNND